MARKPRPLKVEITPRAQHDINHIWDYNVESYGARHAKEYSSYLMAELRRLSTDYPRGKEVSVQLDFRFVVLKRGRGHGYVAVYKVVNDVVEVVRLFHTAQNWQDQL